MPEIPEHDLLRPIAAGAYGQVWLARNKLGILRAVKVVRRDGFERVEDFEREFRGLQRFEPVSRTHDGLVDILQIGREESWFYYVMELADDVSKKQAEARTPKSELKKPNNDVHGSDLACRLDPDPQPSDFYSARTLRAEVKERGALNAQEVITLGQRLALALAHLHAQGLVHRDVKPSNILFVNGQPKLADVGLVAAIDDARSMVGTPGYIPPEGPGTPKADIYSLGKVLYEAAFGKNRQDFPQVPLDLSSRSDHHALLDLNQIILKACEHDVRKRYQSAGEMLAELQLVQKGKSISPTRRLRRCVKLLPMAGTFAVLALGIWFVASNVSSFVSPHNRQPRLSAIKAANVEYIEGRYFYSKNTGETLRKAIARFERAIDIDPNFAAAYGALASCYSWVMPGFQADLPKARRYAEKALGLDEDLAEAHKVLAWIKFNEHDWRGGTKEADRSLKLAPNDPEVHSWYAVPLYWMGRTKESIAQLNRAQELDQTSLSIPALLGLAYMMDRKDDLAIQEINKVMTMETNAPSYAFRTLAEIYEYRGWFLRAIEVRERWSQITANKGPGEAAAYSGLRQAFNEHGPAGYWRKQLDILKEAKDDPYYVARCYAMLGERDNAFGWLQVASTNSSMLCNYLMGDRALDALRADQRFAALVKKLNLDQLP